MTESEIRLECLKLALNANYQRIYIDVPEIVNMAETFTNYVIHIVIPEKHKD